MVDDTPPGPDGLPLLGSTVPWIRDPCGFRERCASEYGSVVNFTILGWDTYMLTDPSDVELVLENTDRFRKHEDSYEMLREIIGNGLVTSDGSLWERQREAIQPAFYMDHIQEYTEIMVDRTAETTASWEPGATISLQPEITRCTLEILVEAMFGEDIDTEAMGVYEAAEQTQGVMDPLNQVIQIFAPGWIKTVSVRRQEEALDDLDQIIYDILGERRQAEADRPDLLSMLLDSETEMSDRQIRDEMLTFLFAGHETTALTLTYAWDLLTRHPEVEARMHDEIDAVCDDRPTMEDVFEFEYLEAILKEAMRLYPPAHEVRREPVSDEVIGGYEIPAGSLLMLPMWVLHRDPQYWDDPESFRPARWLGENDRPAFAYFPFGGGPRRCIGQQFAMTEAQLVLATMAQDWTFQREYDELDLTAAVLLQPEGDVPMRVVPRDSHA
jgi:cytochrome P450